MDRQPLTDKVLTSLLPHLFQTVSNYLTNEKIKSTVCSKEMRDICVAKANKQRPQLLCPSGPVQVEGPDPTKLKYSNSHLGNMSVICQSWISLQSWSHIRSLMSVSQYLLVIVVHRVTVLRHPHTRGRPNELWGIILRWMTEILAQWSINFPFCFEDGWIPRCNPLSHCQLNKLSICRMYVQTHYFQLSSQLLYSLDGISHGSLVAKRVMQIQTTFECQTTFPGILSFPVSYQISGPPKAQLIQASAPL